LSTSHVTVILINRLSAAYSLIIFQTLEDLVSSCRQFNQSIETFECSVFDGKYITGGVDAEYLSHLETVRSDNAKLSKALAANSSVAMTEKSR
jgi:amidophosphoribosyltransferase